MGGLGDALGAAALVLIFLGGIFVANVILIQVFCLAFAPIAGAICAVLARRKGLSVWRYTAAGTVYSVLLFLPWVYLIQRMRGKRFQRIDIQTGYIAFYLLWALLIACNVSFLVMAFGFAHGGEKAFGSFLAPALIALFIGALPWILSGIFLLRRRTAADEETDISSTDIMPKLVCIMPFAYAFLSVLVLPVMFVFYYIR